MFIPKNHDKLQTISEIVSDGFSKLEQDGATHYDNRVFSLAQQAIHDCMPELIQLSNEVVTVEATQGVSLEADGSQAFNGLRVSGTFTRASIEHIIESVLIEETPLTMSNIDLCAVITPVYVDPDPKDIVFGKELYVPFSSITKFEPSNN